MCVIIVFIGNNTSDIKYIHYGMSRGGIVYYYEMLGGVVYYYEMRKV